MKAVLVRQFGPIEDARIEELPSLTPGDGQVVVDLHAAEVNFPDILVMEGSYQIKPPLPFSPGRRGCRPDTGCRPGRIWRLCPADLHLR